MKNYPPAERAGSLKFKILNFALSFCILLFTFSLQPPISQAGQGNSGTLIVKIQSSEYAVGLADYGDVKLLFDNTYRIRANDSQSSISSLSEQPWVDYVERDGVVEVSLNAQDPLFVLDKQELGKQWYLSKIQVHQAWEKTTGSSAITVAVVDTGINAKHEDLNDGRVGPGFANYCQVQSLVFEGDCLVHLSGQLAAGVNSDDNGHGTIVSGVIGAIPNNNRGIAGINWQVKLMPIKALDSAGSGLASDVAVGIRWAADNGANVINLSIGGAGLNGFQVVEEAMAYAFDKGVLIVAAAGNDAAVTGGNLNENPVSPVCADGGRNLVVGVAAVDFQDKKAKFSNYGSNCIDIAAPGTGTFVDRDQKQGLVSTYYDPTRPGENDLYVYALGTSVATPMVSGVAALMMSVFPDLDVKAIRERLISSVDNIDAQNLLGCNGGSCVGHLGLGRLNAQKAVTSSDVFTAGSLLRDGAGNIFLIERGLKRPISSFVLNQRFTGFALVAADAVQLDGYPTGLPVPPADSTIIKSPDNPTVYLVEGDQRRAMSFLSFVSRKLQFENVIVLPSAEVNSYPVGADAPVLDGALMKSPDNPAVFVLKNGVKQLLSFFVFQNRGFTDQRIALISGEELAQRYPTHPRGFLYPPVDGTLVKGDQSAIVYIFENGLRRGLNLGAFQNRGLSFSNISEIPRSELDGYEPGEDIIE